MPKRHRILFFEIDPHVGGSGRSLLVLLAGLDRECFDPVVACPPGGATSRSIRDLGVECHWPPSFIRRGQGGGSQCLWALWVRRLLRRRRIDLLHVNDVVGFRMAGWGAKLAGVPTVCHVRMAPTAEELAWAFGLAEPATLVYNSRAMAEHTRPLLGRSGCSIPGVVILNAVDTRRFRPADSTEQAKHHLGWPPDTLVVTVPGNLSPLKGQDLFLEAAAIVRRGIDVPVAFHVIGRDLTGTRMTEELAAQAERLHLRDCVDVHGGVDDIVPFLQASDVVVLPTRRSSVSPSGDGRRVDMKGPLRCAMEAAACGRPLVMTDTPGADEAAVRDETALLVPPEDPEVLAEAVLRLLKDRDRREAMGRTGRALAESRFDPRGHCRLVERVYTSLLGPRWAPRVGGIEPGEGFGGRLVPE